MTVPLMFVFGAGFSAPFGVPTMKPLLRSFVEFAERKYLDLSDALREHLQKLDDESDIEELLRNLELAVTVQDGLRPSAPVSDKVVKWQEESSVLRAHLVSYIIECCERFDRELAVKQLSPFFKKLKETASVDSICVATTNYDRIIEFVCEEIGLKYADGFAEGAKTVSARWDGRFGGKMHLYKLHGSVTYYVERTDKDGSHFWRLDRGYPLPGPEFRLNRQGHELEPLMVLPSPEKETSQDPYGQLNHRFAQQMSKTKIVVAVGTSMRDSDLVSAFNYNAENVVVLLVDKEPTIGRSRIPNVRNVGLKANAVDFFAVSTGRLIKLFECLKAELDGNAVANLVEEFVEGERKEISRWESMTEEQRVAFDAVSGESGETAILQALWRLRGIADSGVIEAVGKKCEPENSVLVRKAAAGCLGASGSGSAVGALRNYSILDSSADVRLEAYLALEALRSDEAVAALELARRSWPEDTYFEIMDRRVPKGVEFS